MKETMKKASLKPFVLLLLLVLTLINLINWNIKTQIRKRMSLFGKKHFTNKKQSQ